MLRPLSYLLPLTALFFFFNDTATTEIYTLSLHDALPIWRNARRSFCEANEASRSRDRASSALSASGESRSANGMDETSDRKSTRLNSSHANISYAVFCLKKKNKSELKSPHYILGRRMIHK